MVSVKHAKISTKDDGTDSSRVRPTDWNAEHVILAPPGTVLGAPAGPVPPNEVPVVALPFSSVLPAGMIMAWAGPIVPATGAGTPPGWLLCAGQTVSRDPPYDALFAVIQTIYGNGDNTGITFTIPNLMGRVVAGVDYPQQFMNHETIAPNAATLGGKGGGQTQHFNLQFSGVRVAGGNGNFGYPFHHNTGGVWAEAIGSLRMNATTSGLGNDETVSGLQFGGGGSAAQSHDHDFDVQKNFGPRWDEQGRQRLYINPNWDDGVYGASGGRFEGLTYLQDDGQWQSRDTNTKSVTQPTIMLNYIIKY